MAEGALFVVGIGPGIPDQMTGYALKVLREVDCVVGYEKYIQSVRDLTQAECIPYPMGKEIDRCRFALELAKRKRVAVVSSGDPGIFGMASLCLELAEETIPVEVVPGMPALSFAASKVGVPLGGDFLLVSLSDLLVPWERIVYMLDRAALSDVAVVIINPGSKRRKRHLSLAANTLLRYRPPDTPVAIVEDAYTPRERVCITTLAELEDLEFTNMNATVFVGTTRTVLKGNRLITDRGYFRKGITSYFVELGGEEDPEEIEAKSLKFIRDHLKACRFSDAELEVVARMVHASADFSIASLVRFSSGFVDHTLKMLSSGCRVFVDTGMALAGVSMRLARCMGVSVERLPKVGDAPSGMTKSAWALRSLGERLRGSLLVVGNAPTVLKEAVKMHYEGMGPDAVIAVPVGFVGTVSAKRGVVESGIPHLVVEGNRGGTPVAVAALNALLRLAHESNRGASQGLPDPSQ